MNYKEEFDNEDICENDSVEEMITEISKLDDEHNFTVARVMEDGKSVELFYDRGNAYLEYGVREAEDCWETQYIEAADWFNLNLTDDEVLGLLNKEYDDYFGEKEIDFDY